nr:uncharacterized protein LOC128692108 [Cherax quadricarinatus]
MEQIIIGRELQESRMAIFGSYQPRRHKNVHIDTSVLRSTFYRSPSKRNTRRRSRKTLHRTCGLIMRDEMDFIVVEQEKPLFLSVKELVKFDGDDDDDDDNNNSNDDESDKSLRSSLSSGFFEGSDNHSRRSSSSTVSNAVLAFFECQTEELLTDVLYSVHFLMGCSGEGVWAVGGPAVTAAAATGSQTAADSSNRTSVSLDQVLHVLQEAFQVNEEAIERLTQEIQRKPVSISVCVCVCNTGTH